MKLFRTHLKDQVRHYIVDLPNAQDENYAAFLRPQFQALHDQRWQIEQFHRSIIQVCNIERFQVCTQGAILNHIFAALCSFVHLQKMQMTQIISNAYHWKRELYSGVIAAFIQNFIPHHVHFDTKFARAVNA